MLTTDGLLGGICKCKFILAFLSVLTSMCTKGFTIGAMASIGLTASREGEALPKMLVIIFATLILPNLFLAFISISCSTGLNKKLVKVILNYLEPLKQL